jgi:hypothetical protein
LEDCLSDFVRAERLDGFICAKCSILNAMSAIDNSVDAMGKGVARENRTIEVISRKEELRSLLDKHEAEDSLASHNVPKVVSSMVFKEMKIVKVRINHCNEFSSKKRPDKTSLFFFGNQSLPRSFVCT